MTVATAHSGPMSLLLVALAAAAGWGESAAPWRTAGASATGQAGAICRTYPTASTGTVSRGGTLQENISTTCTRYSTSTNQTTCTIKQVSAAGSAFPTTVIANTYNSVADFVDEVKVVPPLERVASVSMSLVGGPTSVRSNTYDAQGRVTRSATVTSGSTHTQTHTAWDSAGRSTKVTFTPAVGPASVTSNSYDDVARTLTITNSGVPGSITLTFDANGNVARSVATSGGVTTTTAYTTTATDRICK